ncbi:MAG: aldo/keto reductase [Acidilobus sp.]
MKLCDKDVGQLGFGTWGLGGGFWTPEYSRDEEAVDAIRYAYERGIKVFDTAEMYGGGHSEELVGKALREVQDEVMIISKVWPNHIRYDDLVRSAEASRRRLGVKAIDLYLIHWPNPEVPLYESIRAMEDLIERGIIRCMGVSNFDVRLLEEAIRAARKYDVIADEVEYSVYHRDPEAGLIQFAKQNNIAVIAYSPLGHGQASRDSHLASIGRKYGKTPVQVALNYVILNGAIPIPKASRRRHIDEIVGSLGWSLTPDDVNAIRSRYP